MVCEKVYFVTFILNSGPKGFTVFVPKVSNFSCRQTYWLEGKTKKLFHKCFFSGLCSRIHFLIFRATFEEKVCEKTDFLTFPLSSSEKIFTGFVSIDLIFIFRQTYWEKRTGNRRFEKNYFRACFLNWFVPVQKSIYEHRFWTTKTGSWFLIRLKQKFVKKFSQSWCLIFQWSFWRGKFQEFFSILSGNFNDGVPKPAFERAQMHIPGWLFWKIFLDGSLVISRQKFSAGVYMNEMNSTCKQIPSEKCCRKLMEWRFFQLALKNRFARVFAWRYQENVSQNFLYL